MMTSKKMMISVILVNHILGGIIKKILVKMKLFQDREARQRFILLRLFTMRLPNISDQAKNGLFIAFSRSNSFGVLEHNILLDALAHPVKGLNLFEYDELGFDLINNAKIQ